MTNSPNFLAKKIGGGICVFLGFWGVLGEPLRLGRVARQRGVARLCLACCAVGKVGTVGIIGRLRELRSSENYPSSPLLPIIPSNPHSTHLPQKIPKKIPKKSEGRLRISPSNLRHLKTYIVETIFCSKYHRPCPKSHLQRCRGYHHWLGLQGPQSGSTCYSNY